MTLALAIGIVSLLATITLGFLGVVRENRRDNERAGDKIISQVKEYFGLELKATIADHTATCPGRLRAEESGRFRVRDE